MDNRKNQNKNTGAEGAFVVIGLFALLLFSSVFVVSNQTLDDNGEQNGYVCRVFIPGAGDGSMTKTEPLANAESVFLTVPALISVQTIENNRPHEEKISYAGFCHKDYSEKFNRSTIASISPEKAEEFTLVGSKPSGTS